jgi:solute carrier family 25 phosphate transporter 23/24/25/41
MEKALPELRWKVGSDSLHPTQSNLLSLGDVSLSAEDKPPPFTANRPIHSDAAATLPVDHSYPDVGEDGDFEEYDVEEHHSWLEGHAAMKFLAAGGIAGAGEYTF